MRKSTRFVCTLCAVWCLYSSLPATARPLPCAICQTGNDVCEDTSSPQGCMNSNSIEDCSPDEQRRCKGISDEDVCQATGMCETVNKTLNPPSEPYFPYSPTKNCGTNSLEFQKLCDRRNIKCRQIFYDCSKDGKPLGGHAINLIEIPGGWLPVDSTGEGAHIAPDVIKDPSTIDTATLCRMLGRKGCDSCTVSMCSEKPAPDQNSPKRCSAQQFLNPFGWPNTTSNRSSCRVCCGEKMVYYVSIKTLLNDRFRETYFDEMINTIAEPWLKECQINCNTIVSKEPEMAPVDSGALYADVVCQSRWWKSDYKGESHPISEDCKQCCRDGAAKRLGHINPTTPSYDPGKLQSCLDNCRAPVSNPVVTRGILISVGGAKPTKR